MKTLGWGVLGLALLGQTALAQENRSIAYVSHDGASFVVFDIAEHHMSYQGSPSPKDVGDLGGLFSDCSDHKFQCQTWGSAKIAVPKSVDLPSEWEFAGSRFHVVQTLAGGDHKVWLISVTTHGDTWFHFNYSRERGVETFSNQSEGEPAGLAVTYFLLNKQGLLAPSP